jgi:hypothetical protein
LEALRRENELLKLNLQVVLEKLRTLEARPKGPAAGTPDAVPNPLEGSTDRGGRTPTLPGGSTLGRPPADVPATEPVETALKQLREARDQEAQRGAVEALEKATKKLREQLNKVAPGPSGATGDGVKKR